MGDTAELVADFDRLFAVRGEVQKLLEHKRRDKVIGSSLEARVRLFGSGPAHEFLQRYAHELPTLFIVSQVEVVPLQSPGKLSHGPAASAASPTAAAQQLSPAGSFWSSSDLSAEVLPALGEKCPRCWTYSEVVGRTSDICEKCIEALGR